VSLLDALGGAPTTATCSRAGCRQDATWRIDWRNPRIHSEDRRKTWLACDEHVEFLRGFLASRDFPLAVQPLAAERERGDREQTDAGPAGLGRADPGHAVGPADPAQTDPGQVDPGQVDPE
jgi:hypothetical protein